MFNAKKPSLDELPSSAQLIRSTAIAAASAVAILVTVVLPAEYNIDPTGIGGVLGLSEMGEIKAQLAEEAEADRLLEIEGQDQSSLMNDIFGLFVGAAHAQEVEVWRDETTFTLAPGDSAEWKLVMEEGQTVEYRMLVDGGRVNFDMHGHGGGQSVTYEKGRGSTGDEGEIIAAFDGEHGWFWRNRDSQPATVTVQVRGQYTEFKDAS
ncbi:transmembrane anchor protein [Sulfitobacter pseudonitzschiae]|uniref:Transmembrane anchor protein n=1 Tax=Pseudosulfitobacter pseudonitzschiae TaxID=1402135 RepID=A0A9Q2RUV8_9RHOB|nr:transmembrane anchor protein [Pseudosulfitobacter pseudonitzschiae]MBM2294768.1 transmembrane anchor protein [Pseudosulfitobacter pseudonitzschiae]MBM2299685.1 transmembrane anchor protein [Pseudosulfitobacter pseudonitzschiae]MBM2304605.1 transmembrane anchor protein [Pseudosulfitobacter pseudonitzschiae]MBM2314378.1 transmembrane anchor protein [Pseudosulfitobacter pseudonitzschiae]MBM2319275.1 transmembrane anchor protein [Pseudosulfitobacter pseudonitzschiae]